MSKPRKRFAQTLGFHSTGVAPGRWGVPRGLPGTLGGLWGPGLSRSKKKKRPSASVGFQSFIKGGRAAGGLQGSPFGPKKNFRPLRGQSKIRGRVGFGWVPGASSGGPVPGSGSRGPGAGFGSLAPAGRGFQARAPGSGPRGPGPGFWLGPRVPGSGPGSRARGPGPRLGVFSPSGPRLQGPGSGALAPGPWVSGAWGSNRSSKL